jgi:hypothetical protein
MKSVKWLLFLCVVAMVVGCSSRSFESRLNVESYLNPDGNYGSYHTYAWVNYNTDQLLIKDPKVRQRVVEAIENELKSRGLTYDADSPDLMVGYHGAVEQKLDEEVVKTYYDESGYALDTSPGKKIDSWEVGTLMLLIFDAKNGNLLWRATAQAELDDRASAQEQKKNVELAVHKMLETMPTKKDIEDAVEQRQSQ